jgi:hypothetical protein
MHRFGLAIFAAVLVLTLTVGNAYAQCADCPTKAACKSAEKAAPVCAGCNKACAPQACAGCQKVCAPRGCCQKVCAHRLHCAQGGGQHFNLVKECKTPCQGRCTSCKCQKVCNQAHLCGEQHKKGDDHHQCCKISKFFGWHSHCCCGCYNHRGACAKPDGQCCRVKSHGWYKCDHRHFTAAEATVR